MYAKGLKLFNIQNSVVDFQLQVGQATSIIQYVLFTASLTFSRFTSISHKASKFTKDSSCFKILITTFSQKLVGKVESLISIFIFSGS
ncbi:MAG: hypothetical protein LBU14_01620 [Candidatus Peribacteria bacterium]|nr:hypothetical protein [Candidatus Peribacteria bacterium]